MLRGGVSQVVPEHIFSTNAFLNNISSSSKSHNIYVIIFVDFQL